MAYYGNHRDYSLSPLRDLAYNNAARADAYMDYANNQRYAGMANSGEAGKSFGARHDPGRMASQEAGNMMQQAMRAMETGLSQEQMQVQDRQLDLPENNLAMQSADRRYAAELDNDARKYAADAARVQPIGGYGNATGGEGNDNPLQGLYANAPSINLLDRDGNRIGGSRYNR